MITQAMVDAKRAKRARQDELGKLRALADLIKQYDEHIRHCTACLCRLHCPVEQEQWKAIRKALYALGDE